MRIFSAETIIGILILLIFLTISLLIGEEDRKQKIPAHHHKLINTEVMKCELSELPKEDCLTALKKRIYRPTIQEMDNNPDYNRW